MAKAKKEKPTTPAAASTDPSENAILTYLRAQNRPYSAVDIFNNLHGAVGKTAVVKLLASLAERGEITVKAFGKQLVYVARQDLLPVPSTEELNAYDDKIDRLKEVLQKEKEHHKLAQAKLSIMNSSLSTAELIERISGLEREIKDMEERLEPLERGAIKIDPEERGRIERSLDVCTKAWKLRKKMCMEIVGMLTESSGQKPAVFMEEVGLEAD